MNNRLVAFAFITILTLGCATRPNTSQNRLSPAKTETSAPESPAYTILARKDESIPNRKRLFFSISAPEAKGYEVRGKIVIAASRALQRDYQADVVEVWLEPNDNTQGLGFVLAMATYSPDGKGMSGMEEGEVWYHVQATDYQLGPQALRMTKQSRLGDISIEQAKIINSRRAYLEAQ